MTTMPGIKELREPTELGRVKALKDTTKLQFGATFDDEVSQLPVAQVLALPEPFGDTREIDERYNLLLSRIGGSEEDMGLVRQMVYYQDNEVPYATTPELLLYTMLTQRQIQFAFQVPYRGGRAVKGGLVLDFLVNSYGEGLVIAVQGDYWHSDADTKSRDKAAESMVMGQVVNGLTVTDYVEAYESDLYADREGVLESSLAGRDYRS